MSEFIQIHWTCRNIEEARNIATSLLEKKLVGCASIIPEVESLFLWNGKIDSQKEVKVIFKTKRSHFEAVREEIERSCSYEVPEILQIPVVAGSKKYLEWLDSSTN